MYLWRVVFVLIFLGHSLKAMHEGYFSQRLNYSVPPLTALCFEYIKKQYQDIKINSLENLYTAKSDQLIEWIKPHLDKWPYNKLSSLPDELRDITEIDFRTILSDKLKTTKTISLSEAQQSKRLCIAIFGKNTPIDHPSFVPCEDILGEELFKSKEGLQELDLKYNNLLFNWKVHNNFECSSRVVYFFNNKKAQAFFNIEPVEYIGKKIFKKGDDNLLVVLTINQELAVWNSQKNSLLKRSFSKDISQIELRELNEKEHLCIVHGNNLSLWNLLADNLVYSKKYLDDNLNQIEFQSTTFSIGKFSFSYDTNNFFIYNLTDGELLQQIQAQDHPVLSSNALYSNALYMTPRQLTYFIPEQEGCVWDEQSQWFLKHNEGIYSLISRDLKQEIPLSISLNKPWQVSYVSCGWIIGGNDTFFVVADREQPLPQANGVQINSRVRVNIFNKHTGLFITAFMLDKCYFALDNLIVNSKGTKIIADAYSDQNSSPIRECIELVFRGDVINKFLV